MHESSTPWRERPGATQTEEEQGSRNSHTKPKPVDTYIQWNTTLIHQSSIHFLRMTNRINRPSLTKHRQMRSRPSLSSSFDQFNQFAGLGLCLGICMSDEADFGTRRTHPASCTAHPADSSCAYQQYITLPLVLSSAPLSSCPALPPCCSPLPSPPLHPLQ